MVFLLTTFIAGCGAIIGFWNLFKSILFVFPFLFLLPIGGHYVIMHFDGRKQFFLFALWLGFVSAITAIVGMLLDARTYPVNWFQIIAFAGISWLAVFVWVIFMTPVYSAILRAWKRK